MTIRNLSHPAGPAVNESHGVVIYVGLGAFADCVRNALITESLFKNVSGLGVAVAVGTFRRLSVSAVMASGAYPSEGLFQLILMLYRLFGDDALAVLVVRAAVLFTTKDAFVPVASEPLCATAVEAHSGHILFGPWPETTLFSKFCHNTSTHVAAQPPFRFFIRFNSVFTAELQK